jgi:hypothetical protein
MFGWAIVPKGQGDLAVRLGLQPGADVAIEISVFLNENSARKRFGELPAEAQVKSEVRRIGVIFP